VISFPGSKINLGLQIHSRLPNGYHILESVFYPIPFTDVLDVAVKGQVLQPLHTDFEVTGLQVEGEKQDNLVWKAYELMQKQFDLPPIVVHLHKHVPTGAGLGGGSADASAMLKTLNVLFNLCQTNEQLAAFAAQLGSDCPFFIHQQPMNLLGTGRELQPFSISLAGKWLVLLHPGKGVSTKDAYANVKPAPPLNSLTEVLSKPIDYWKEALHNDFENTVFPTRPDIAALKEQLYKNGASYAAMSGSGAAVFGLFEEKPAREVFSNETLKWQGMLV